MSEEKELTDSRKDDLILVVEDVQLQGKCPSLLRQVKGQLPVVMHCAMMLIRHKPQMTREDTEALHSWQILQEMMERIRKLAKDTDAALATCFVKLQDLHMRVVHDLYHPDVLKVKNPEAIGRIIRRFKAKFKELEDAVTVFKGVEQLMDTQKDLQGALRDVGADWAKKALEFVETLEGLRETKWQKQREHMKEKNDKMLELIRKREDVNLEGKVQKLVFWEKKSWMAEKSDREFQKLNYEASRDYAQESETKTHYYTTGWLWFTRIHTETVKNPRKEEKMRKKEYLETEANVFEEKHGKINDEIAKFRNEVKVAREEVAQIDEEITKLVKDMDEQWEERQSNYDAAIKHAKNERERLDVTIENFGTAAALMNVLEAIERFKLLGMQSENVHYLLSRILNKILSRYGDWIECMEDFAEDPSNDDLLKDVRVARDMIADPNIAHPNPFFDMETEPENAGKKLLEY